MRRIARGRLLEGGPLLLKVEVGFSILVLWVQLIWVASRYEAEAYLGLVRIDKLIFAICLA